MFPQITKNKKKVKIGTDEMIKDCEQIMKQLEYKHKKSLKSLPAELVSDFHKVCRLKDIRPFYAQYFFYFVQNSSNEHMQTHFAEQVENIMLGRSFYQQIQSSLKERKSILNSLKEQLHIVEGFSIMNSGKNLPIALKGMINNLIKDCVSLEQVKTIQINQVEKLTEFIIKARDNLKSIAQMLISWQYQLRSFCGEKQPASFKKMKIIYPENGINCVLLGLYDFQFVKTSFLCQQMKFLGAQFDPFLLYIEPIKKTSKILKEHLLEPLQSNGSQLKKIESFIFDCIPKNQQRIQEEKDKDKQKNKEKDKELNREAKSQKKFYTLQKEKNKQRKKSQKRIKNEFLTETLIKQANETNNLNKNSKNHINIDSIFGIYKKQKKSKSSIYKDQNLSKSLSKSKSRSIESLDGGNGHTSRARSVVIVEQRDVTVSSSDNRSKKSVGSIDKAKVMSKTVTNMKKVERIQNVYKLSNRNHSVSKVSLSKQKETTHIDTQKFLKEKEQLLKQLSKQKKEQQTLKKIIKRVENRTSSQNKYYDIKVEEYEKQIELLKQRIRDRQGKLDKSPKQNKNDRDKNKLISKVYQNRKSDSPTKLKDDPEINMAQSRLIEEKNTNKMLENKIKELIKEKNKLENLIEKEGSKVNKEKQMYQRKLQKYQEIISFLKKQSIQKQQKQLESNKRFSLAENDSSFKDSPSKSITNEQKLLKLYAKRQTIQAVGRQKQSKKNFEKTKETKAEISSFSPEKVQKTLRKSEQQPYDAQDLQITNSRNTIQIVYNPKKHKKHKKSVQESTSLNQQTLIQLKQKQHEYEKQMFHLEKQKSLLQRKLDMKMDGKSGTEAILMKKLQQSEQQLEKYKEMIDKEKSTNIRYDERMKELRKKINEEYEQKIQRERKRFQEEREHLFHKLKEERESKLEKDKYLSKQMIFLKEMQMRQNELMTMLENERKERIEKERYLEEEILQKQQILQQYELQEIKRVIEKQVREEMNLLNKEEEQQLQEEQAKRAQEYERTKEQVENEIREMLATNDYELKEIDEENEKLKELIERIKQEEQKVIANLQTGIVSQEDQQDDERIQTFSSVQLRDSRLKTAQNQLENLGKKSRAISRVSERENFQINLQTEEKPEEKTKRMIEELQHKSDLQLQTQRLTRSRYQELKQSPIYKERQKLQNIIQHYLKNPHQYPSNNKIILKPQQKTNLIEELTQKSKKAKQFQQQLMELKNVQSFVPAQRDDPISNHMLSLRQAYQNEQTQALRRALFPAFNEEQNFNQEAQDLSFESQEPPPPITFGDHLKVHQDKYMDTKQNRKPSKNFMAINRMKLLKIQEEKKEKERQMIQEETKKKLKKIIYKAKKKQEKDLKEFLQIKAQLQEKQKKRQIELQKAKKGQQSLEKSSKQDKNQQKKKQDKKIIKSKQPQKKNQFEVQLKQAKKEQEKNKVTQKKQSRPTSISKERNDKTAKKEQDKETVIELKNKQNSQTIKTVKKQQNQDGQQNQFLIQHQQFQIIKNLNQQVPQKQQKLQIQESIKPNLDKKLEESTKALPEQQIEPPIQVITNQREIQMNQVDQNDQEEQKKQEEDYYDEEFQEDQQEEPNEFIPKETEALRELKQKLGKISLEIETKDQNKKLQQEQKDQEIKIQKQQESKPQDLINESQMKQLSQNLPLMLLEHERSSLKQDLLSYQDEIRSYISSYSQFQVYQHFVQQKELLQYIDEILELSSEEIKQLNNNPTLKKDIPQAQCLIILVAKDKETKLELGIGVFHKEFQHSQYVCGYLLAHDMKNFLNLTFNFSRYIYQHDSFCHSVQYIFTISALLDETNKVHFDDFENKCKRLGEIYVKGKQSATRKYVLKRHLFQYISNQETFNQEKGIIFESKVQIHENFMKQKNQGYHNEIHENFCSPTILLSYFLKNNPEELQAFKNHTEEDLKNRQTLVTAMVFAKKDLVMKNIETRSLDTGEKIQLYKNVLGNIFTVDDMQQQVQELKFSLIEKPPKNFKRCVLQIDDFSIPYCFVQFEQALNRVQASNSAEIGTFIPLVPKFKVLIIPGEEFLISCSSNPDMNVFFYTKHFIKNITEVKKENIRRVFLPEIKSENWAVFENVSQKMKKTIFGREKIQIGYESKINNSVIFAPKHDDLVIEKPFIISILSASIERTIEGSPIFCKLIQ